LISLSFGGNLFSGIFNKKELIIALFGNPVDSSSMSVGKWTNQNSYSYLIISIRILICPFSNRHIE